jgi:hypothetical protein
VDKVEIDFNVFCVGMEGKVGEEKYQGHGTMIGAK